MYTEDLHKVQYPKKGVGFKGLGKDTGAGKTRISFCLIFEALRRHPGKLVRPGPKRVHWYVPAIT